MRYDFALIRNYENSISHTIQRIQSVEVGILNFPFFNCNRNNCLVETSKVIECVRNDICHEMGNVERIKWMYPITKP